MTQARKEASKREKELELAIFRIERGRSHTKAEKLSISAVAREAGVTPALIHNHYPGVAEKIRVKLSASSRQRRDEKQKELQEAHEKNRQLQQQLTAAEDRVDKLASINESLLLENRTLKAATEDRKVVRLPGTR
ncbi:TetR family transcriptional regulator [Variovorax sp. GB1R11]|uniref:TetR family transcriptional regulator n=1 Tax=Variovorax sp. GB1R11 TaxID=3443741 RepID=UPI003F48C7B4